MCPDQDSYSAQELDVLAGGRALGGSDDEEAHRGLQEPATRERQVRAAQRVLANLVDLERDLADLQVLAAQEDDVGADEQRLLELALGGLGGFLLLATLFGWLMMLVDYDGFGGFPPSHLAGGRPRAQP